MESSVPASNKPKSLSIWFLLPIIIAVVLVGWFYFSQEDNPKPTNATTPTMSEREQSEKSGLIGRQNLLQREPEPGPENPGIEAYQNAVASGDPNPGMKAFRANADAFFYHNVKAAEEKAAREGISTNELRELTYLGLLAMQMKQWNNVEAILGHPLEEKVKQKGTTLIFSASDSFKMKIREHVANKDSVDTRWQTIQEQEEKLISDYLEITGLQKEQLDQLLAAPFRK